MDKLRAISFKFEDFIVDELVFFLVRICNMNEVLLKITVNKNFPMKKLFFFSKEDFFGVQN